MAREMRTLSSLLLAGALVAGLVIPAGAAVWSSPEVMDNRPLRAYTPKETDNLPRPLVMVAGQVPEDLAGLVQRFPFYRIASGEQWKMLYWVEPAGSGAAGRAEFVDRLLGITTEDGAVSPGKIALVGLGEQAAGIMAEACRRSDLVASVILIGPTTADLNCATPADLDALVIHDGLPASVEERNMDEIEARIALLRKEGARIESIALQPKGTSYPDLSAHFHAQTDRHMDQLIAFYLKRIFAD